MLDLNALLADLATLSEQMANRTVDQEGRMQAALDLLGMAEANPDRLLERLTEFDGLHEKPWLLARPRAGAVTGLPAFAGPSTVIATDGSQIAPSHHEIAMCYLINVGLIMYTYGTGEQPLQYSRPTVKPNDELRRVVGGRSIPMTEDFLALERQRYETAGMIELAWLAVNRGHPTLALVDGTLIQFMLQKQHPTVAEELLRDHLADMEQLRGLRVPVAGYLSHSRSADVVNMLKLVACPKEKLVCASCAPNEPPCEARHVPLADRRLWERRLKPGDRSPLFHSASQVLDSYPDHQKVLFFYLHVGAEIARLEVPAWVANDPELLDRVHALAYDQAQKGMGYPISLQEAHNQAVVGREDRSRFFALLSQRMAQAGVKVAVSSKQLKKRVGVV